ncbi:MAG: helix-hairpin-helix domain-containing protein [Candidatus Cryptobacteroides sp.]|nr:helix-hairpin-helix domain-containing protein [Candidatus Cryptobacteroides sp.]
MDQKRESGNRLSASFVTGAVALIFLAIGYQTALFVHRAAVLHIAESLDHPDTVYIVAGAENIVAGPAHSSRRVSNSGRSERVQRVRNSIAGRSCENFRFNPNTVSLEDLQRLGFSARQAESIDNYRRKGGRFRRKEDFMKSYVVEDSVYERLKDYIDIPKLDINAADSAAFETLPGIGPFYAAKMVSYRKELHGYSYPEQLMDIYRFDEEKYSALADLIEVGPSEAYPLWTLPEDSLKAHPYIRKYAAHGVVVFRENNPVENWTIDALDKAGVLDPALAPKLKKCRIVAP